MVTNHTDSTICDDAKIVATMTRWTPPLGDAHLDAVLQSRRRSADLPHPVMRVFALAKLNAEQLVTEFDRQVARLAVSHGHIEGV